MSDTQTQPTESQPPAQQPLADTPANGLPLTTLAPSGSSASLASMAGDLSRANSHTATEFASLPACWSSLIQSLLTFLSLPSYPQPLEPLSLFYWVVASHIDAIISQLSVDSSVDECVSVIVRMIESRTDATTLSLLHAHLHCHLDQFVVRALTGAGYPSQASIPHIAENDSNDEIGGARSIRGISGGSVKIFSDSHSARLHTMRVAINQILCRTNSSATPVLVFPNLPNSHTAIDRLLFDLGLPQSSVKFVPLVAYQNSENYSEEELTEPKSHIGTNADNPLLVYHLDTTALASLLAQSQSQPVIVVTLAGSCYTGHDELFYYEDLSSLHSVCKDYQNVWVHCAGESLFGDSVSDSDRGKHSVPPSLLYQCTDSIAFNLHQMIDSTPSNGANLTVVAFKSPPRSSSLFPVSFQSFAPLFTVWFALSSHYHNHSIDRLLVSVSSARNDRLLSLTRSLLTTSMLPIQYVAPLSPSLSHSSHRHVFFTLTLTSPLAPQYFNLTLNEINTYVAHRLALRAAGNDSESHAIANVYGREISPAAFFDSDGFVVRPLVTSTDTSNDSRVLFEAMKHELAIIEQAGLQREKFHSLLSSESEFEFVPVSELAPTVNGATQRVGVGAFRFVPAAVSDSLADQVQFSLNKKLRSLHTAMQHPWPMSPIPPVPQSLFNAAATSRSGPVSCFKSGLTKDGRACTVIDITPLLLTRGLETLWSDVRAVASHLQLPKRVMADVTQSVVRGIREAEKKLDEASHAAYSLPNVVSWLPVVGPVIKYMSHSGKDNTNEFSRTPGQSFDLKKKELNVIRYSYKTSPSMGPVQSPALPAQSQTQGDGEHARSTNSLLLMSSASTNNISNLVSAEKSDSRSSTPSLTNAVTLANTVSAPVHALPAPAPAPLPTDASLNDSLAPSIASTPAQTPSTVSRSLSSTAPSISSSPIVTRPPSLSKPSKRTIAVNIDENDRNILRKAMSMTEVTALLTTGVQFTSYLSSTDADNDTRINTAELVVYYAPRFTTADTSTTATADSNDLGRGPILAWCEPGVPRYLTADQALAIEHITEIYVGRKSTAPFPKDATSECCITIATTQVTLNLRAKDKLTRDEFFRALYALLASQPSVTPKNGRKKANGSSGPTSGSETPVTHKSFGFDAATGGVPSAEEFAAAQSYLTRGNPFAVHVISKDDAELTTRHEVSLWFRDAVLPADAGRGVTGYLCWCRRGSSQLEFSPSRSLPITPHVQVCLGKQTKAFKNASAASASSDRCFSIMVEKMILNLEAPTPDARAAWLKAFHAGMMHMGKQRVTETGAVSAVAAPAPSQ